MTRKEAKELLPIIQAFVNGKTIEARTNSISRWKLAQVFEKFTFTDGTPFGMKVEE